MQEKFKQAIADLFEININELTSSFCLTTGGEWESLNFIMTNAMVDKYFGFMIKNEALRNISTFSELTHCIDQRSVAIQKSSQ